MASAVSPGKASVAAKTSTLPSTSATREIASRRDSALTSGYGPLGLRAEPRLREADVADRRRQLLKLDVLAGAVDHVDESGDDVARAVVDPAHRLRVQPLPLARAWHRARLD